MADLKALKKDNPIQQVLMELGTRLVFDPEHGFYFGQEDPRLRVDPARQRYSLGDEEGDVLNWLVRRFGWTFGQAVTYLKNRALAPAEGVEPSVMVKPEDKPRPAAGAAVAYSDAWQVEVFRMAGDYPGGLDRLFGKSWVAVVLEKGWMPYEFAPVIGLLEDGSCSLCGQDFSHWIELGEAYRPLLAADDATEFRSGGDVYCARCIGRIQRWHAGLDLLARQLFIQADTRADEAGTEPVEALEEADCDDGRY